jgi:phosphoesterase RecJ-like protein
VVGKICRVIRAEKSFLVTTHRNPDGDAVGSALALRHMLRGLGKGAVVWMPEGVPGYTAFLDGAGSVLRKLPPGRRFDATLVVDAADEAILAEPLPPREVRGTVIVIDHHATRVEWGDLYLFEGVSAVGEIIFKLARRLRFPMTAAFAECIYVAIMTDTGSFRYDTTTPEVMRMAARCIDLGVSPWRTARLVYETYPRTRIALLVEVLSTLEVDLGGAFATITSSADMLRRHGLGPDALEDFVNFPRAIEGVEVAALLRRREDGSIRVSLRSRGRIDVASVALRFGGGGHRAASGCTFPVPETIEGARAKIKKHLEEACGLPGPGMAGAAAGT